MNKRFGRIYLLKRFIYGISKQLLVFRHNGSNNIPFDLLWLFPNAPITNFAKQYPFSYDTLLIPIWVFI